MKKIYYVGLENHLLSGNHYLHFSSKIKRLTYLQDRVKFIGEQSFQDHAFLTELTVPFPYHQIKLVNYLYFFDGTSGSDLICYHITNAEYMSVNTSKIFLSLDIYTTYQFDIIFKPSFVERCHVDRWNNHQPTMQLTAEPFGEYEKTIVHTESVPNQNGCYIYTSVNPLGTLTFRPTAGSGGGGDLPPSIGGGCGDLYG